MGQFSWIYSDTNRQLIDNRKADTYLLVPEEFQSKYGKSIYEWAYNGYGRFGKYDVYDLVIEWNREMIPDILKQIEDGTFEKCYLVSERDINDFKNYYEGKPTICEARWLGIILGCGDETNFSLKYPIKITTKEMDYSKAKPSKRDPNQGWYSEEYDLEFIRECQREEVVDKWCKHHSIEQYDSEIDYYDALFAHLESVGLKYE
jgi:hypothetical protein